MSNPINYVKNPYDLVFCLAKSRSKKTFTQKEFSEQLRKAARRIKGGGTKKGGPSKIGFSRSAVSGLLHVDYFALRDKDSREHDQFLNSQDQYVLNSYLSQISGAAYTSFIHDRKAIEAEIKYRFPREAIIEDPSEAKKLENLRGVWQFLHVSLRKDDMDAIDYGSTPDQGRYMIRDGVLIFFGFNSHRIKTLLLGSGTAWKGEAWLRSEMLYLQLNVPENNKEGYLIFHAPEWLSFPLDPDGEVVLLDGMRFGTISDRNYKKNSPIVALRCVMRRLDYPSRRFLANDNVVDEALVESYKQDLCRYQTLEKAEQVTLSHDVFVTLSDEEKFARERDLELARHLENLRSPPDTHLEFPTMQFRHRGRKFGAAPTK